MAVVWLAPVRDFAVFAVTNAYGDNLEESIAAATDVLIARYEAAFR